MKRKNLIITAAFFIIFQLLASPSYSCVGRVLVLALENSPDQTVVGQLLATMITERTGTTVEIVTPGDKKAIHEAMTTGKAQIYINYLESAKSYIEDAADIADPTELYATVRQGYIDEFDFIMLKPFGYDGPVANGSAAANASLAVPVTTKEVLKNFPVLDRVINKLGGKVDHSILEELTKMSDGKDLKAVVKEFLKTRNMI